MLPNPKFQLDVDVHRDQLIAILKEVFKSPTRLTSREHQQLMRQYPRPNGEG